MAEIIRAEHSGFCFGVKQAIEKTEEQIKKYKLHDGGNTRIYTCGQLIHNQSVTDSLATRGVGIIETPGEAQEGDTVIVRSHGEGKSFFEEAQQRGLKVVDATCPFVNRIHQLVSEADRQGKSVVIVGDRSHPEVAGINGWCENKATIVNSREEAAEIEAEHIFLVCQTTIKKELLDEIVEVFEEKNIDAEINNTICSATRDRQEACAELAAKSDAMVIIGGRNLSLIHI